MSSTLHFLASTNANDEDCVTIEELKEQLEEINRIRSRHKTMEDYHREFIHDLLYRPILIHRDGV